MKPPLVDAGTFTPSLSGRINANTFFNKRKRIVLGESWSFDDTPNRFTTTHATGKWKATLTRTS